MFITEVQKTYLKNFLILLVVFIVAFIGFKVASGAGERIECFFTTCKSELIEENAKKDVIIDTVIDTNKTNEKVSEVVIDNHKTNTEVVAEVKDKYQELKDKAADNKAKFKEAADKKPAPVKKVQAKHVEEPQASDQLPERRIKYEDFPVAGDDNTEEDKRLYAIVFNDKTSLDMIEKDPELLGYFLHQAELADIQMKTLWDTYCSNPRNTCTKDTK